MSLLEKYKAEGDAPVYNQDEVDSSPQHSLSHLSMVTATKVQELPDEAAVLKPLRSPVGGEEGTMSELRSNLRREQESLREKAVPESIDITVGLISGTDIRNRAAEKTAVLQQPRALFQTTPSK